MEFSTDPFARRDKYPHFLLLFNVIFQQAEGLNVSKIMQFGFTLPSNYMNGKWMTQKYHCFNLFRAWSVWSVYEELPVYRGGMAAGGMGGVVGVLRVCCWSASPEAKIWRSLAREASNWAQRNEIQKGLTLIKSQPWVYLCWRKRGKQLS